MAETLIVSGPNVMMGKPVVAGTRITVELILEKLGSGETIEQLLEAHPRLTREGVLAALLFASKAMRALTEPERLELAEEIFASLGPSNLFRIDAELRAEIRRRSNELDAGMVTPIPWSVVKQRN